MLDSLWLVLVAGGSGRRLGAPTPKQYLNLAGRPLFLHALTVFGRLLPAERIVLVLPPGDEQFARGLIAEFADLHGMPCFAAGGATRQASVASGLAAIPATEGIVAIHDAARPFFRAVQLEGWVERLDPTGDVGLVPVLPMADTVLALDGQRVTGIGDRAALGRAQTPQLFPLPLIRAAHAAAAQRGETDAGDDVTLVAAIGKEVIAVPGDERNVKITTPDDLVRAEHRLGGAHRVGFGYDSHRFDPERPLILGGVTVPSEVGGLAGHSDADVLTHAVIDALLGAAALGDIGQHFPDSDPAYAGADSLDLLVQIVDILAAQDLAPAGLDATLIAERPKLRPHIDAMRAKLAAALSLPLDRVNVKATTNEGMGAIGRGEGMAAQAVATLKVMSQVRVRFAPSPTGSATSSLHMGVARTAIFNWLYARHSGGVFVLRIEDTDAERSSRASEQALLDSLRWLGLDWDEGPDAGGEFGPYRQSERLPLYRAEADRLVAAGQAYPCFCAEERLAAVRAAAKAAGEDPRYDGACAGLAPAAAAARVQNEPHTIRFRMPTGEVVVEDAVRGSVRFQSETVGDFVLLRESGLPVYNFACVVDDAAMGITHVLRGEDHLPNTLRQLLLYEALGQAPPVFGHLSMILGEDKSKLSKRHGAVSVEQYRDRGYPPAAIVNYLALLGWNPGDDREDMSPDELITAFSLERLNKSAAVFDPAKLDWLSGVKLRAAGPEALLPAARAFLPDDDDDARLLKIRAVIDHLRCAADLPKELASLQGEVPEPDAEGREWLGAKELFAALANELAGDDAPLTPEAFKAAIKAAGKATGAKGKGLFMPVRVALTGLTHGPDLAATATILGRAEVVARLRGRA